MSAPARISVGFVARAHGIRGEVCAVTHDPESTTLGEVDAVWIGGRRIEIRAARDTAKGWLLALDGIDDRNAADALRGAEIEVERDEIPLGEDEMLLADLVGCAVRLPDGTPWGEIVGVELGPQLRLVVRDGAVEREVPFVEALVPSVDLDARVVTVDPPEGLPETPVEAAR